MLYRGIIVIECRSICFHFICTLLLCLCLFDLCTLFVSSYDNKSVSHWIMFDYFFHV